jgi:hypothetical protein
LTRRSMLRVHLTFERGQGTRATRRERQVSVRAVLASPSRVSSIARCMPHRHCH